MEASDQLQSPHSSEPKSSRALAAYDKPVLYYSLAIGIPWALWGVAGYISYLPQLTRALVVLESIIGIVGLATPMIAAFALMLRNRVLRDDLRHQLVNFRHVKPQHYVVACLLMPISLLAAQAVSLLFGFSASQFSPAVVFSFTAGVFPACFLLIIAPVMEELGWHTYGTNGLRNRMNLFAASLLFAAFWGVWHMPLSLIKGYYQNTVVVEGALYSVNFLVSLVPFVIIMNWLYYKTHRNLLVVIVFHITAGFSGEIFQTHPMSKVIQTVLLLVLSGVIVVKDRGFFFDRRFTEDQVEPPRVGLRPTRRQLR